MIRLLGDLARDRRAGTGILIATALPLMIGMAAFAIDFGAAQLETRRLQGVADNAALAATADPANAQIAAAAAVAGSGLPRAATVTATTGRYDPSRPLGQRFTANAADPQAVRVTVEEKNPTFFARVFGIGSVTLRRSATASQTNLAAFSIGSRLASMQGGVLNALLSGLTGSSVSLSVMDYNTLAGAQIDLLDYLDALRTRASLTAGTYDDTLDAQVTTPQLLNALADALPSGNAAQASAIRGIAAHAGAAKVALSDLIDLGPVGNQGSGGRGIAKVDALTLLSMLAQIGNGNRQVQLDLGTSVAGITQTRVWLAIGQRPGQSPWLTVTASGTPIIRTAQMRLYVEATLANLSLPLVGSLAAIKVPLYVELAGAEARLDAIDCSGGRTVTIGARPSPGEAAIATIDPSKLNDFSKPVPQSTARLLHVALLADVDAMTSIDLGSAEPWQQLRFSQNDIDQGTIKTVSSGKLTGGIAASLISGVKLSATFLGILPIDLSPLTKAVGQQLAILAPLLDTLIDAVTGLVGVHLGQGDVRVTGLRCGAATLVG